MVRLVDGLSRHRVALFLITAMYLVFVVTMHDVMQRPAYWVQGKLTHRGWNNLVTVVAVPILVVFCVWMFANLRRHTRAWIAGAYLAMTVFLSAVFFHTLLCMNIEVIHFPQYAIFAVFLFALTGSFAQTVIWSTLAGLVDEGYQFFYLHSHWRTYLDFNDIILNSLGAGFGLVMLYGAGVHAGIGRSKRTHGILRLFTSPAVVATGLLVVVSTAMYASGLLRVLPSTDARTWTIVLRRGGPSHGFWAFTEWGKTYHEVQLAEWVVVTLALIVLYSFLDCLRGSEENS